MPQMIEQKKLSNGFEYIELSNKSAHARIARQGAHLFHYERIGQKPLLWLSETSFFESGKAIRGGIPICWPWFGKHKTESSLPQHGFARNLPWELLDAKETDAYSTEVTLQLQHSAKTLTLWPYMFELQLRITVSQELSIALTTKNCGKDTFEVSSALHSYFAVANIDNVSLEGLHDIPYYDALTKENKVQRGTVSITEEVDRVYQQVHTPLILHDQDRTVHIRAEGSSSVVVWNPWVEKCARMSNMKDDAYKTMVCIETANALADARKIPPDTKHTLLAAIS